MLGPSVPVAPEAVAVEVDKAIAGALKGLQASLRHLTWQTTMIAGGDFSQRVDFIFTRNIRAEGHAISLVLGRDVVGDDLSDRTSSGLWPSDHGGVVASFLVAPAGPRLNVVTE